MPDSAPSISVLLPVRDGESHLDECLQSLFAQSHSDFEIVAVDDGSVDATPEILDAWRGRDARLRIVAGPAAGLVAALNRGLEHCTGDLIARMDADDTAHVDRLRRQRELLESRPDLAIAACRVEHFSAAGVGEGLRIYERWLNSLVSHDDMHRERFIESPVPHPGVMFRRSVVVGTGGYRDVGWPEDYDLWLRLFESGCKFGKIPEILHFWRDRPDRASRVDPRYAVERFLECKAEYLARGPLANCSRVVVWGAGQTGRRLTKHLLRRGAPLVKFIDIDPAKRGRTVRGVPVEGPRALARGPRSSADELTILAAVSSRGARAKIRAALDAHGFREGENFWCVA